MAVGRMQMSADFWSGFSVAGSLIMLLSYLLGGRDEAEDWAREDD